MDLIARLRESRPSLSVAELAAASTVEATFEGWDELRDATTGEIRRVRVYSVSGALFERQPIIIRGDLPVGVADAMAQQGLQDTIQDLRDVLIPVHERVVPTIDTSPSYSDGLNSDMRLWIERALADRYGRKWKH